MAYYERYGPYVDSYLEPPRLEERNRRNPHSKFVVVLQMHHTRASTSEDLVLATRALAREVQEVGFHFYILYQVPRKQIAEDPQIEEEAMTREEMLALLPVDLQGVAMFHDALEDFKLYYPKVTEHANEGVNWGPGPRGLQSGMSIFMQRFRSYEFAYWVESDVRLVGSHWGRFLAAALQQGIKAEGTAADSAQGVKYDGGIPTRLPTSLQGMPDLLGFGSIWPSPQWLSSQVGFNETQLELMRAMVYGGSRRFFDAMHELLRQGRSMYFESLLPAIPRLILPRGKVVAIRVPSFGESFHCCVFDGTELYSSWFKAQDRCLSLVLIHPVKNKEPFWPSSPAFALTARSRPF